MTRSVDPTPMDPRVLLAASLGVGGSAQMITELEAAGQGMLVAVRDRLPRRLVGVTRAQLEAIGFVFDADPGKDPLFQGATFPPGWTPQKTGHVMYSDVLDARGRKRASVMYKAAFYDRDASVVFLKRYRLEWLEAATGEPHFGMADAYVAVDDGTPLPGSPEGTAAEVEAWLTEQFPAWQDVTAYWDDPTPTQEEAAGDRR